MSEKELKVTKIESGTVIDHIPAGRALEVIRILGITGKENYTVAILMNVESKKLGKKDLIKIENRVLEPREAQLISLVAPDATLNVISNFEVKEKYKLEPPKMIEGLIKCPNELCITNKQDEPILPKLKVVKGLKITLECIYCGATLNSEEITKFIL